MELPNWLTMVIRNRFSCTAGGTRVFHFMVSKVCISLWLDFNVVYTFVILVAYFKGAAFQPGAKTVIPGKVIGKFSIRIVPNQEPEEVEKLVFDYVNKKVIN